MLFRQRSSTPCRSLLSVHNPLYSGDVKNGMTQNTACSATATRKNKYFMRSVQYDIGIIRKYDRSGCLQKPRTLVTLPLFKHFYKHLIAPSLPNVEDVNVMPTHKKRTFRLQSKTTLEDRLLQPLIKTDQEVLQIALTQECDIIQGMSGKLHTVLTRTTRRNLREPRHVR